jgi:hypothetical protein
VQVFLVNVPFVEEIFCAVDAAVLDRPEIVNSPRPVCLAASARLYNMPTAGAEFDGSNGAPQLLLKL